MSVRYRDEEGTVTFGQLLREAKEFFFDAAGTGTTSEVVEPMNNTHRGACALGALEPGTYRFTVRPRTGVVESVAIGVRRGG